MKIKVLFGSLFVILAFGFMFADALFYVDYNSKPSMALTHGAHGGNGGGHGGSGTAQITPEEIALLPLKTSATSIKQLPYTMKDGVKEFQLTVDEIRWEYSKGKYVHAWAFNGQVPGPEIRVTNGDKIRVLVKNNLPTSTSVHWHGLEINNSADGVPGYTQYPIEPGATFTYEFTAKEAGTRFYHSHGSLSMRSVTQVDMGLSGAFIIEPENKTHYDREYVYILDEWQITADGLNGALAGLSATGGHEHDGSAAGYNTFTINGKVYPYIEPLKVSENDSVLIRLINVGSQDIHPMHTHGHSFYVSAIDGNPIPREQQIKRDVITVHPAERYDLEFTANNPGAWLFHCHHLHHAAAGMVIEFLYDEYEPCCLEGKNKDSDTKHDPTPPKIENHASLETLNDCLDKSDDRSIEQCAKQICGSDEHCYEEIEELKHE